MKKLTQLLMLGLVAATLLAVPALAQEPSASPAAAATTQEDPEAKAALYKKVTDNFKGPNQQIAYEAAKEYLQKYPNDDPAIVNYLKTFVEKYEKGSRQKDFETAFAAQKWPEAYALGKQIVAEKPDDLTTNLRIAWAGLQMALANNNTNNAEAANFSQKSIQLIESGKTPDNKPYADKDKQEHLGWLNYSLGFYNTKNNKPGEAAAAIIKSAGYESTVKNNPVTYVQLANVYEAEYGRLQESYDATYKGKPETDESKAVLLQVKNFLEPMIDAYARAVAYSGDNPAFQQIKTAAKQRLEELYKFARGSADGMDALIASVKTKPIPPQPSANITAPATMNTSNTTDTNTASGMQTGATAPATTTPATTTPANTTNPATNTTPTTNTTTPATNKTPATNTKPVNGTKPVSKTQSKTTTKKSGAVKASVRQRGK
jgi:hypothetical protein